MPFMWGHRWHDAATPSRAGEAPQAPPALRERKFWEGSEYGVAVPAGSFPGIIAIHADARFLLNFREQVGVQPLLEDLGRQPGVASVALLDGAGRVLAHSDPGQVEKVEADPELAEALREGRVVQRRRARPGNGEVYEVARPLPLGRSGPGILRVNLSLEPLQRAWRQVLRSLLVSTGAIFLVGVVGVHGSYPFPPPGPPRGLSQAGGIPPGGSARAATGTTASTAAINSTTPAPRRFPMAPYRHLRTIISSADREHPK